MRSVQHQAKQNLVFNLVVIIAGKRLFLNIYVYLLSKVLACM